MGTQSSARRLLAILASAVLGTLMLVPAALAAPHHPQGEFAPFADCPLSRATLGECVTLVANGGSFTVGKKTVPIKNPVTLQGGYDNTGSEIEFFGAEDGNTLSKTPQPVPGGLTGASMPKTWPKFLQKLYEASVERGLTNVKVTLELAAPATAIGLDTESLFFEEGTALRLPVKFHLENPFLGGNCYLGSNSHPVVIPLTTGTSGALHGSGGEIGFNETFTLTTASNGRLVDNTYEVPGATGCGGFLAESFVDPLIDKVVGLPAAGGRNSAVLEFTFEDASANVVRGSEQ